MAVFWAMTGALALMVTALLVLALLRGRRETGPAEAFDMQVYRDQLSEIDRDVARGVLSGEEAERLRTEVSRRLLSADAKTQGTRAAGDQPRVAGLVMAGLIAVTVMGGGVWLYAQIGAPGYPDLPLQARINAAEDARLNRPTQLEAEASVPARAPVDMPEDYMTLVERLRGVVAERPDDLQGHALLVRSEAALGNYDAAWRVQDRFIQLRGPSATAADFADLADMMVLAAGGYVSPDAEGALNQALRRDPSNGVARYYAGLMMAQTGRPDIAFRMWERLLRDGPDDAPWLSPIRQQIEEMAFRAGVSNFQLPEAPGPALPGPSAEDMQAAADMSPEDRAAMISGMVDGLSERLATQGGPPEEWARLITALGVLGRQDEAQTIWQEARTLFGENAPAVEALDAAAARAGLTQ